MAEVSILVEPGEDKLVLPADFGRLVRASVADAALSGEQVAWHPLMVSSGQEPAAGEALPQVIELLPSRQAKLVESPKTRCILKLVYEQRSVFL